MSSIGHPCSTIQGSARYLSLMRPGRLCFNTTRWTRPTTHAVLLKLRWGICLWWDQPYVLPRWINYHYPMPEL